MFQSGGQVSQCYKPTAGFNARMLTACRPMMSLTTLHWRLAPNDNDDWRSNNNNNSNSADDYAP